MQEGALPQAPEISLGRRLRAEAGLSYVNITMNIIVPWTGSSAPNVDSAASRFVTLVEDIMGRAGK